MQIVFKENEGQLIATSCSVFIAEIIERLEFSPKKENLTDSFKERVNSLFNLTYCLLQSMEGYLDLECDSFLRKYFNDELNRKILSDFTKTHETKTKKVILLNSLDILKRTKSAHFYPKKVIQKVDLTDPSNEEYKSFDQKTILQMHEEATTLLSTYRFMFTNAQQISITDLNLLQKGSEFMVMLTLLMVHLHTNSLPTDLCVKVKNNRDSLKENLLALWSPYDATFPSLGVKENIMHVLMTVVTDICERL